MQARDRYYRAQPKPNPTVRYSPWCVRPSSILFSRSVPIQRPRKTRDAIRAGGGFRTARTRGSGSSHLGRGSVADALPFGITIRRIELKRVLAYSRDVRVRRTVPGPPLGSPDSPRLALAVSLPFLFSFLCYSERVQNAVCDVTVSPHGSWTGRFSILSSRLALF